MNKHKLYKNIMNNVKNCLSQIEVLIVPPNQDQLDHLIQIQQGKRNKKMKNSNNQIKK